MNPSSISQRFKSQLSFVTRAHIGFALIALISASPDAISARPGRQSSGGVTILVYNYAKVPAPVLTTAEREATRILGFNSVELTWLDCAPAPTTNSRCLRGWTKQSPGLRFISGFNKYQDREFGHADIPVLATIYYEKVAQCIHSENADPDIGAVLGALMAHELGHLLLEDPKHSTFGVMEASWGPAQIASARRGKLLFTAQQTTMLRRRLELGDDADQTSNSEAYTLRWE